MVRAPRGLGVTRVACEGRGGERWGRTGRGGLRRGWCGYFASLFLSGRARGNTTKIGHRNGYLCFQIYDKSLIKGGSSGRAVSKAAPASTDPRAPRRAASRCSAAR